MPDYPLFIVVASPMDEVMQLFEHNTQAIIFLAPAGLSIVMVAFNFVADRPESQTKSRTPYERGGLRKCKRFYDEKCQKRL